MKIHQLADVHPDAELAGDVEVGAFAVIGPHVRIGYLELIWQIRSRLSASSPV